MKLARLAWTWRRRSSRRMELIRQGPWSFVRSSGGSSCWRSLLGSQDAWWPWRLAPALITGLARSPRWGTRPGSFRPYVKPFVKRQKNDMADAEAICEAAQRPTMRFVRPKSAEAQGAAVVFRTRDLLVRQRTQLINALRGHLAEFGFVVRQGPAT